MKTKAETETRVELKYCESCGALQLRPMGSGLLYCAKCEERQAGEGVPLTRVAQKRRSPRLPSGTIRDLQGCVDPSAALSCAREVRI